MGSGRMKIVVLDSHTLAAEADAWAPLKRHGDLDDPDRSSADAAQPRARDATGLTPNKARRRARGGAGARVGHEGVAGKPMALRPAGLSAVRVGRAGRVVPRFRCDISALPVDGGNRRAGEPRAVAASQAGRFPRQYIARR